MVWILKKRTSQNLNEAFSLFSIYLGWDFLFDFLYSNLRRLNLQIALKKVSQEAFFRIFCAMANRPNSISTLCLPRSINRLKP